MMFRFSVLFMILAFVMATSAQTKGPGFTITKLTDNVYAALGEDGGPAGSNAGFVIGSNGVAVIDTFAGVAPAKELLKEIRKLTNLPIRYVINTHYHLDHVGGNAVFAEAGATIFAQRSVAGWIRTENLKFFGADPKPERRAQVEALVLPDVSYSSDISLRLGDRVINVSCYTGHTGGDSVVSVHDKDTDIVFGGDMIWQKHLPNLIDANTERWLVELDLLVREHPRATFVSGHGGLATATDVTDFRNYLTALRTAIARAQAAGRSGEELISAVTADLKPIYGTWGFFDHFIKPDITFTQAEMKGTKKFPISAKQFAYLQTFRL